MSAAPLTDEQIRLAMVLAPAYCDDADYAHYIRMGRAVLAAEASKLGRTEQQIVDQTEAVAALLAGRFHGSLLFAGSYYRHATNPRAQQCWQVACQIQELLTATDVENAVAEIDGTEVVPEKVTAPTASEAPKFPTMLRKMWSGGEVQAWIDENWQKGGAA